MSADPLLAHWSRPARRRGLADDLLAWLPLPLVVAAVALRRFGPGAAIALAIGGGLIVVAIAWRRGGRFDRRWLIGRLDADRADMEDSADLLFADEAALNPLQRIQQIRLRQRLAIDTAPDLRPAWSGRRIALVWIGALLAITVLLAWPRGPDATRPLAPSAEHLPAVPGVPRLTGQRLRIVPPAYTGLPARDLGLLDARVPAGSRLEWALHFDPQPSRAILAFHTGERLALRRVGDDWSAGRIVDRPILYRVLPQSPRAQPVPPLHRLDVVIDAPPVIRPLVPNRSLSIVTPGQRAWPLSFAADDDYGVAPNARLRLSLAHGEGENISFREHVIDVRGSGAARTKTFSARIDLAGLGFAKGDDLVAQLIVADMRRPAPHVVRGPSLILRWPSDLGTEATGLDAMSRNALPAYFSSERQIINDAEALLKIRRKLDAAGFLKKSDGIGADQQGLRMRYGQFLGQENEGHVAPPPTSDADPNLPVASGDPDEAGKLAPAIKPAFGRDSGLETEYGHVHDESEATTLFDPKTRAMLKQVTDNMWQSELNLRQGHPDRALPYAYKALGFLKQVQQATRIFLARVGPELPPIDETRRMTGKRDGLARRDLVALASDRTDPAPVVAWHALEGAPGAGAAGASRLDALERWIGANAGRVPDPLAFTAAIDAVRRDPGCAACRERLRGLLWAALARPPVNVARRDQGDAAGRRYLDALVRSR